MPVALVAGIKQQEGRRTLGGGRSVEPTGNVGREGQKAASGVLLQSQGWDGELSLD